MKTVSLLRLSFLCFLVSIFIVAANAGLAESAAPQVPGESPQGSNPPAVLAELAAAFSGPLAVHKAQLSGTVTYYVGSLEDSGTVSLTAADDGSSQMQLDLSTTGQITESQTGKGSSARCQWSRADEVSHNEDVGNCWRPALWFLPSLSLQPSALSNEQVFADLGEGNVGFGKAVYRHLQGQVVPSGSQALNKTISELTKRSTTDIGLNPASTLPSVLSFAVHPNNGAPVTIAIEIHYSDYRTVAGVQIPFHIERFLNGSPQLDIHLSSATIN